MHPITIVGASHRTNTGPVRHSQQDSYRFGPHPSLRAFSKKKLITTKTIIIIIITKHRASRTTFRDPRRSIIILKSDRCVTEARVQHGPNHYARPTHSSRVGVQFAATFAVLSFRLVSPAVRGLRAGRRRSRLAANPVSHLSILFLSRSSPWSFEGRKRAREKRRTKSGPERGSARRSTGGGPGALLVARSHLHTRSHIRSWVALNSGRTAPDSTSSSRQTTSNPPNHLRTPTFIKQAHTPLLCVPSQMFHPAFNRLLQFFSFLFRTD